MNDPRLPNSYDQVPYPSYPYPQTHPERLATIATLLGVDPPRAPYRVLELGCAAGGNLIPMAAAAPNCHFVGVDLSPRQIADGQAAIDELGLTNLKLHPLSILDIDQSMGSFDYILCHGVYSWVNAEVQSKILELCATQLSKNGIAYISYNTHPGWRQRGALRDMMRYHVSRFESETAPTRIRRARELLDFLVKATQRSDSAYGRMLREQHEMLQIHSDSYIFHEHLEQHNEPLWFLDFCGRLEEHGLRYLGDSDFGSMVASMSFTEEVQEMLEELAPNLLEKEQYMDFVRNRAFRQTLVCHAHLNPNYDVKGERLRSLFAASPTVARPAEGDHAEEQRQVFSLPDGLSISTPMSATRAALEILSQAWPARVAVSELVDRSLDSADKSTKDDASIDDEPASDSPADQQRRLEISLLTAYASSSGRLLELSIEPLPPVGVEGLESRPLVSSSVRHQAERGWPVVNRRHEIVEVAPIDRRILPLLDGTRSIADTASQLVELLQTGQLSISDERDQPISDQHRVREILDHLVPERIQFYLRGSLIQSAK